MDIRTVLILTTVYTFFLGSLVMVYHVVMQNKHQVYTIGLGFLSLSAGFLLIGLRDYIGEFNSIVTANTCIVGGNILVYYGVLKFFGKKIKTMVFDLVLFIAFALSFMYFTYWTPSINTRVVIIALVQMYYHAVIIGVFYVNADKKLRFPGYVINLIFGFSVVWNALRLVWTLFEPPLVNFMAAGWVHAIAIVIYQILPFSLAITLFWMSNIRFSTALELHALQDPLTGLYNRRALFKQGSKEVARAKREGYQLGVVICDLDNFKRVNDTHSHDVGDRVLVQTARMLSAHVRSSDILSRYGGEEFVMIFQDVDHESLGHILEKLRESISTMTITVGKTKIRMTMSFGAAFMTDTQNQLPHVIKQADEAMYEAKTTGKNKVVIKT